MGAAAAAGAVFVARAAPRPGAAVERLRLGLLWFTGFAGAFVFMEPSPYEIASLVTVTVFALTGLALSPALMPFALFLVLLNLGYSLAAVPVLSAPKTLTWILVSWYLAVTAVFFAAMLGTHTERRLRVLLRGYTAAAVCAALAGIVGYFHLAGGASEIFLRYGRVQGTFNDPNVLGAFLVLPALLAMQRMVAAPPGPAVRAGVLLTFLVGGLFLTFSRGAWTHFGLSALVVMVLTFVTSRSAKERLRILAMALLGVVLLAAFVAAMLSIEKVAALFAQRASLDQSYDVGHLGRFGRHALGFLLALDTPIGIGPLQFATIFPEDPHNSYLNAFMSGGWLGGIAYLTLIAATLGLGLRFVFVATPWHGPYVAVYATFVGVAGESAIIDSDHWRHFFLVTGVLWGLMAASRRYLPARRPAATTTPTRPAAGVPGDLPGPPQVSAAGLARGPLPA